MAEKLRPSIRSYLNDEQIYKRYIRPTEATVIFKIEERRVLEFALAASAVYQLPRTTLINHMKMEEYMKHLYKVPNTSNTYLTVFCTDCFFSSCSYGNHGHIWLTKILIANYLYIAINQDRLAIRQVDNPFFILVANCNRLCLLGIQYCIIQTIINIVNIGGDTATTA